MPKNELIFPEKMICETQTNNYGKFLIEPYEPGYAHTVGNSLRRILLSSIKGSAITSLRIKNVSHEFDIIKNVKEDVMFILLNFKKTRLKMFTEGPEKIFVSIKGEKVITAGDFNTNPNIEIINPDLIIAHIGPGGIFEAELEVEQGRGYVIAEENKQDNKPVDTLYLDSLFSPITKVNYEIEPTRVRQKTDYDKLIMEIWSDGSILPSDALAYASKIMKDSLKIFGSIEEKKEDSSIEMLKQEKINEFLQQPLSILGLSTRPSRCLIESNIKIVKELIGKTEEELMALQNMGKKSVVEIKEKLLLHDLQLGQK